MKKSSSDGARIGTLAVHAGHEPEPMTGAITPPIFQTSTYVQPDVAVPKLGYDYARVKNPTVEVLERKVAALEGGTHGIAFSSGLAAIEAVVKRLSAGDHVVYEENTYGGVTRVCSRSSGWSSLSSTRGTRNGFGTRCAPTPGWSMSKRPRIR